MARHHTYTVRATRPIPLEQTTGQSAKGTWHVLDAAGAPLCNQAPIRDIDALMGDVEDA